MPLPTEQDLTNYLHQNIPLSRAMDVKVVSCDGESAVLRAPLAPNINHRNTAFGGSVGALALLSGWTLIHARLTSEGRESRLVIQENTIHFRRPISGEFTARCELPAPDAWARFLDGLERKGAGRITLKAVLQSEGIDAAFFEGEYVALGNR